MLVLTLLAAEFDEPELGPPAGQVGPEFLLDEGRDAALGVVGVAEALEKLIEVPFDQSVEERLLSPSGTVFSKDVGTPTLVMANLVPVSMPVESLLLPGWWPSVFGRPYEIRTCSS